MADGKVVYEISGDNSQFNADVQETKKTAESAVETVKGIGSAALKAIGAAAAAVGAAIIKVGKDALASYADFEQLQGGMELLFGTNGAKSVEEYAARNNAAVEDVLEEYEKLTAAQDYIATQSANAWASVQMSQNDYLRTANAYAVGLKDSLGGDAYEAALLTDRILTAQADIVAATGINAEMIANGFAGVMRGNYTMLDSLGIGIKGSQEGMQEVIDKVNAWNEANGQATKYVMGNYADMQQALVDYVEMQGLAGYAAEEASHTIQGSVASMKGAWTNFLVGLASGDSDLTALGDNLLDAFGSVEGNIVPVIEALIPNISTGLEMLIEAVAPLIPKLLGSLLPVVISGTSSLISSLLDSLPMILGILTAELPRIANLVLEAIISLVTIVAEQLPVIIPQLIAAIATVITSLSNQLPTLIPVLVQAVLDSLLAILQNADQLLDAGRALIRGLIDGVSAALPLISESLPEIIDAVVELIPELIQALVLTITECLPTITNALLTLFTSIVDELPTIITLLTGMLPTIVISLVNMVVTLMPQMIEAGMSLFVALIQALPQIIAAIVPAIPQIVNSIVSALIEMIPTIIETGVTLLTSLLDNLDLIIETLCEAAPEIIEQLVTAFINLIPVLIECGIKLFTSLIQALPQIIQLICVKLPQIIASIVSSLIAMIPQLITCFVNLFGAFVKSLPQIIANIKAQLPTILSSIVNGLTEGINGMYQVGANLFQGLINGIKSKVMAAVNACKNAIGSVISGAKSALGIGSPSKVFRAFGEWVDIGLAQGIERFMALPADETRKMSRLVETSFDAPTFDDLNGSVSLNQEVGRNYVFQINLQGAVECDGLTLGMIALQNMDDAAAFALRG